MTPFVVIGIYFNIGVGPTPKFGEGFISQSQFCADSPLYPNTPVCSHAHIKHPKIRAKVSGLENMNTGMHGNQIKKLGSTIL